MRSSWRSVLVDTVAAVDVNERDVAPVVVADSTYLHNTRTSMNMHAHLLLVHGEHVRA